MNLEGEDVEPQVQKGGGYHIDMISDFACTFIDRFRDQPFFFYLACRAPHVSARRTGEVPRSLSRRDARAASTGARNALRRGTTGSGESWPRCAGTISKKDTLIFVISDNGAPLKIHKLDAPGGGPRLGTAR